jgi:hypothetical protein
LWRSTKQTETEKFLKKKCRQREASEEHFHLTRGQGRGDGHPLQPRQSGSPPPPPRLPAEPPARTTAAPSPLQDRPCSLDNRKADPKSRLLERLRLLLGREKEGRARWYRALALARGGEAGRWWLLLGAGGGRRRGGEARGGGGHHRQRGKPGFRLISPWPPARTWQTRMGREGFGPVYEW